MNPSPRKAFGRLEILCVIAAVALGLGSVLNLWPFQLPIALVLLAVVYGVLRDLRSLNALKQPVTTPPVSRNAHAERQDRTAH
jgi:hypothetical protein